MLKNKLTKKILASLLIFGAISGSIYTNVQAANTSDSYWQFYKELGNAGNHYIPGTREKQDATAAYVNITYDQRPGTNITMWVTDANHNSLQGNQPMKTVSNNGQYSIHNKAYETNGKSEVTIGFYTAYDYFSSWSASGVWSPDSTKTYN
ncbi:hypothetical protein [Clostridium sp.]|jgi:hypothetical protein|uniref:hypothetical protein n=1 Tax=Clostridium sp. TaxID=1506 RepID=UPI002585A374|nr:hypothetical protein [Clostridium sp.]MDF2504701.1 hypothetical protein [Clostridium sp.]